MEKAVALKLDYTFKDKALFQLAMTHRSCGKPNNERLEFLGDSLVNMLVAEMLFQAHPHAREGELSRLRSQMVSGAALAKVAQSLDLGHYLQLGPGELKSGGFRRASILADAFEALLAAIYLDGGFNACKKVVVKLFHAQVTNTTHSSKDAKTRLQEYLQARHLALPDYELLQSLGKDHDKTFIVRCCLKKPAIIKKGEGSSRRQAEQQVAQSMLDYLKNEA